MRLRIYGLGPQIAGWRESCLALGASLSAQEYEKVTRTRIVDLKQGTSRIERVEKS